jgi:hypothetical protein
MDIKQAIKILNENHHRFDFPSEWQWVRYRDGDYISGVTLTKNPATDYAGDSDSMEGIWFSDFEAVAIAEKYLRDELP